MTLSASIDVMEARRDEMPERAQAALDLLVSDVARFRGLVEDLLEISRFDAGAIRLHLEDLRVSQFVRNAVAVSSAPTLEVHDVARAENAIISGDRRRLARVVANLIDNALAYGAGQPEVSIEDGNADAEVLTHVKIAVEDHGPGVPVEERALIFERFSRGISAGQRSGSEGAGLGLALVDEHIRLHDGRVWVEDRSDGAAGCPVRHRAAGAHADRLRGDVAEVTTRAVADRRREGAHERSAPLRALRVAACAAVRDARRRLRDPAGLGAAGHPRRSAGAGGADRTAAGGCARGSDRIYLLAPDGDRATAAHRAAGHRRTMPRRC